MIGKVPDTFFNRLLRDPKYSLEILVFGDRRDRDWPTCLFNTALAGKVSQKNTKTKKGDRHDTRRDDRL